MVNKQKKAITNEAGIKLSPPELPEYMRADSHALFFDIYVQIIPNDR